MVSGIIGNLLQVSVPSKTLWLLQTTCANALLTTSKQGVKGLEASFWGVRDVLQASKLQKRKGNVKGDTWLWFEARWCSARDTGTTQTTVTGTGKMTLVTTTKKKKRLVFFFYWAKRNEHSFTAMRPIKAQQCCSCFSNPGLSIARSTSL